MKDRQLNKDAIAIEQSEFYSNTPTHKVETKFVTKEQATAPTCLSLTAMEWGEAYARMTTCSYAAYYGNAHDRVCMLCDWILPDGCVNCRDHISACMHYVGTQCELFTCQPTSEECMNCKAFVTERSEEWNF